MKLRSLLALILSALLVVGCGSAKKEAAAKAAALAAEAEFHKQLVATSATLVLDSELALILNAKTSKAWRDAIEDRSCCGDWQEKLKKARAGMQSEINAQQETGKAVDEMMKKLANPPEKYKASYDVVMQMYLANGELKRQAIDPTGSLLTYNQAVNKAAENARQAADKFKVTLPPAPEAPTPANK